MSGLAKTLSCLFLATSLFGCRSDYLGVGVEEASDTSSDETSSTESTETSSDSADTSETDTGETDTGETDTGETDTGETDTGETDTGEEETSGPTPLPAEGELCTLHPLIVGDPACQEGSYCSLYTAEEEFGGITARCLPLKEGLSGETWDSCRPDDAVGDWDLARCMSGYCVQNPYLPVDYHVGESVADGPCVPYCDPNDPDTCPSDLSCFLLGDVEWYAPYLFEEGLVGHCRQEWNLP